MIKSILLSIILILNISIFASIGDTYISFKKSTLYNDIKFEEKIIQSLLDNNKRIILSPSAFKKEIELFITINQNGIIQNSELFISNTWTNKYFNESKSLLSEFINEFTPKIDSLKYSNIINLLSNKTNEFIVDEFSSILEVYSGEDDYFKYKNKDYYISCENLLLQNDRYFITKIGFLNFFKVNIEYESQLETENLFISEDILTSNKFRLIQYNNNNRIWTSTIDSNIFNKITITNFNLFSIDDTVDKYTDMLINIKKTHKKIDTARIENIEIFKKSENNTSTYFYLILIHKKTFISRIEIESNLNCNTEDFNFIIDDSERILSIIK